MKEAIIIGWVNHKHPAVCGDPGGAVPVLAVHDGPGPGRRDG